MDQLSSAPDNELLNAAEVTRESSSVSVAKMLYENMFAGAPDASNPHFLAFISPLARSTKQQPVFNTRSLDDLRDDMREMFLMVSYLLFLKIFLTSSAF